MKEVYLANLPYEVNSDEIYSLAQDFGDVKYVDMPSSFDGLKNRGYCIVKFSKPEEASKFQAYFENETINGRKIRQNQQLFQIKQSQLKGHKYNIMNLTHRRREMKEQAIK